MKKQQKIILGQLRELLTIVGSLLFASSEGSTAIIGLIIALASLAWSVYYHEGKEKVFTTARKFLTLVPAALVAFDIIPVDKAAQITGAVLAASSLIWSFVANKGNLPKNIPTALIAVCLVSLSMASCALPNGVETRLPISGAVIKGGADGKTKIIADQQTITKWISHVGRILSGEDIKTVIIPTVNPQK